MLRSTQPGPGAHRDIGISEPSPRAFVSLDATNLKTRHGSNTRATAVAWATKLPHGFGIAASSRPITAASAMEVSPPQPPRSPRLAASSTGVGLQPLDLYAAAGARIAHQLSDGTDNAGLWRDDDLRRGTCVAAHQLGDDTNNEGSGRDNNQGDRPHDVTVSEAVSRSI